MGTEVLFYAPNIVGYIRLCLLFGSLIVYDTPLIFLTLYGVSVALDALDGYLARKLNQISAFGAWLDVLIDLISRGALWCFISRWGYFMMMVEWLTFVCTHSRGPSWKIPDEEFPVICKMVMAKGFKTPVGAYAITGMFVLPLWIYAIISGFLDTYFGLPPILQYTLLVLLAGGRTLALTTENWSLQHWNPAELVPTALESCSIGKVHTEFVQHLIPTALASCSIKLIYITGFMHH